MKPEQEEYESESINTNELQKSENAETEEENYTLIINEQITIKEEVVILQSPEYESETNNNNCKFYKQNLTKRALAGVF